MPAGFQNIAYSAFLVLTGSQLAFLIYADGRDIMKTSSLSGGQATRIARTPYGIGLDYHWEQQTVFWTDSGVVSMYKKNTFKRYILGSIPHIIVPLTYTLNCKSNVVSKAL